ncbi:MAG: TIGR04255 family protein [Acidithiobacillus ferrooxidans]|nr:TIGR04255 family protein [Acidithiobacillus ferridurans]
MTIPTRLGKSPLTQVVFELRIASHKQLPQLLPGILFNQVGKDIDVKELPMAMPPAIFEQLKSLNPQLKYQPEKVIRRGNVTISIGENIIAFTCEDSYPGWQSFNADIKNILDIISASFDGVTIERYSMKYINILSDIEGFVSSKLKLKIETDGEDICGKNQFFSLRTDYRINNVVCVVTVISHASAKNSNMTVVKTGTLLDVDAICEPYSGNLSDFLSDFAVKTEVVHGIAKNRFFSLVSDEQLEKFGPVYS